MEGEDGEDEWHREQQNDISIALWRPELEGGRPERVVKTWVAEEQTEDGKGDAWEKRQKALMWRPKLNVRGK